MGKSKCSLRPTPDSRVSVDFHSREAQGGVTNERLAGRVTYELYKSFAPRGNRDTINLSVHCSRQIHS
jgi:hypothetical protein